MGSPGPQQTDTQRKSEGQGKKRRAISGPVVATEVRRSGRIKEQLNGFKSAHCSDKNYFGCSCAPPQLSKTVIKNLGKEFCKISPEELSDDALVQKKKGKKVIGPQATSDAVGQTRQKKAVAKKKSSAKNKSSTNEDKGATKGKK